MKCAKSSFNFLGFLSFLGSFSGCLDLTFLLIMATSTSSTEAEAEVSLLSSGILSSSNSLIITSKSHNIL